MSESPIQFFADAIAGSVNVSRHMLGLLIKTGVIDRQDAHAYFQTAIEEAERASAPQQQIDQLKSVLAFVGSIQPRGPRSGH